MLDLAEASAAGARRDVPAMRAAFRRGGERVAAQYLKEGLRSGVQELECWAELINRVLRSAYTLRQPELIEDAQREYDRLVPPGTPLDTHTPAQVIEAEKKIKVYRADASKRKR
jgi:hypothetical protein